MELQTILDLLAEFNGQNHGELARKYNLPSNTVYRIISHAARVAIVQGLSEGEEKSIALLWAGRASQLGSLQGSLAVLKAAEKAINSDSHHHAHFALVALHSTGQATAQGSSSAAPSADQVESQPDTQDHKSDLPAAEFHQPIPSGLPCATSMSPFTVFLGRLVEHLGAEIAINLVREFAGQSIQFPITQDYTGSNDTSATRNQFGFSSNAPVLGAEYVRPPKDRTAQPLQTEPHRLSVPANGVSSRQLLMLAHQLAGVLPALKRLSAQVELTHLAALAATESLRANPVQT